MKSLFVLLQKKKLCNGRLLYHEPSQEDSKFIKNLFWKFIAKILHVVRHKTGVLMLMCEVQHQHYSCRTRITGFVADNMKGQEEIREKIFSKREGENLGFGNMHLFVYWFWNFLNTYRWLLDFSEISMRLSGVSCLETTTWINAVAVVEFSQRTI